MGYIDDTVYMLHSIISSYSDTAMAVRDLNIDNKKIASLLEKVAERSNGYVSDNLCDSISLPSISPKVVDKYEDSITDLIKQIEKNYKVMTLSASHMKSVNKTLRQQLASVDQGLLSEFITQEDLQCLLEDWYL